MLKRSFTAAAIAVMAGTALSADFNFPSSGIPGGYSKDEVKQIVSYIWDDNAYSGLNATSYETAPNQSYADQSWVDGQKPWELYGTKTGKNDFNLKSGDFGVSWAVGKLAAGATITLPPAFSPSGDINNQYSKDDEVVYNKQIWKATGWMGSGSIPTPGDSYQEGEAHWVLVSTVDEYVASKSTVKNPDGTPIHFSFNVISGLFVPQYPNPDAKDKYDGAGDDKYKYRVSKYGYWKPNADDKIEFPNLAGYTDADMTIPAIWGREQPILDSANGTENVNKELYGQINNAFKMVRDFGHEIGNHTIDHMETNSPLPNDSRGFGRWGGEGFSDKQVETVSWGDTTFQVDEAQEFHRRPGISWQKMGWKPYAGNMLSETAWAGLIELGEEEITNTLGLSVADGSIHGFRAPRLEVSSGLYFGLVDKGYEYDCGIEEGYEANRKEGTNYVWPYTTDNGTPNFWTQKEMGEHVGVDSMPAGLWEYPVNAMIIPEDLRAEVNRKHNILQAAQGEELEDLSEWDGKVTGFDFNMFILYGMSHDEVLSTLSHTLDQRMAGNKAPMHVGCHTDYFTPMYDNATLLSDGIKDNFGIVVDSGWNTWKDRIQTWEDFRDYAINKGANFKTAHETIEYVKSLLKSPKLTVGSDTVQVPTSGWDFDGVGATSSSTGIDDYAVDFTSEDGTATFTYTFDTPVENVTGIHVPSYLISQAIRVSLVYEGDEKNEVGALLNNIGRTTDSKIIPVYQLETSPYDDYLANEVDKTKPVVAVVVTVLHQPKNHDHVTGQLSGISLQTGGDPVGISQKTAKVTNTVAFNGINNGDMNLNISKAGNYSINFYGINGRLVKSIDRKSLTSGVNSVNIGSLPSGMYILNIQSQGVNFSTKAIVR